MAEESVVRMVDRAAFAAVAPEEDLLRARTWTLLGRLLGAPPDEAMLEVLSRIDAAPETDTLLGAAWDMLRVAAGRTSPAELDDEFHDLFIGVGRGELMPYGSWYLTGFLMEQPLARLRSELTMLGFERQEGVCEPEDHAAALCEVMGMIAAGEQAAPIEIQEGFFARHVASWMGRFFRDLQAAPSARFYRAVGQLGEQFVELEKNYLRVPTTSEPAKVRPRTGQA
jgi:TorA maturation chaperone TorD